MPKLKLLVEIVYDVVPENYGVETVEEMATIDQENFTDDLGCLIEFIEDMLERADIKVFEVKETNG